MCYFRRQVRVVRRRGRECTLVSRFATTDARAASLVSAWLRVGYGFSFVVVSLRCIPSFLQMRRNVAMRVRICARSIVKIIMVSGRCKVIVDGRSAASRPKHAPRTPCERQ